MTNPRSFARRALVVGSGTAISQLALVASSPLLTRLYEPDRFGLLTSYLAITTLLSLVAALGLQFAIPLPEDDRTANDLRAVALLAVTLTTSLSAAVLLLFREQVASWVGTDKRLVFVGCVVAAMLVTGAIQVMTYWAIRRDQFNRLAQAKAGQGIVTSVSQVVLGIITFPFGLLLGDLAGRLSSASLLARRTPESPSHSASRTGMRSALLRYRRFPLYSSWGQLLNGLGAQLPPLLIVGFYGTTEAGWFGLSYRVLALPAGLIGSAIASVYVGEAAQLSRDDVPALLRLFDWTVKRLALLGVVPFAIVAVVGPVLFGVVFGDSWRQSGVYSQVMAPMLFLHLLVGPVSLTLNTLEQQRRQTLWDLSRLVVVVLAILAAVKTSDSALRAVVFYSIAASVTSVALLLLSRRAIVQRVDETAPTTASR